MSGLPRSDGGGVPPFLVMLGAWAWRLIAVGIVLYGAASIVTRLEFVVLPCVVSLLLCALLYPLTERLRRLGLPSLLATWLTMLLALGVLGGVGAYVGIQANAEFPRLASQVQDTSKEIQDWLVNGPLHMKHSQLQGYVDEGVKYLEDRRAKLASTAVQAGQLTVELVAAFIFMLFVVFFLLKDGEKIWAWLISGLGRYQARADRAGRAAWETLSFYVRGTVMVAAIHAVVLAVVLSILGVPLVAPLAVIIFLASFIPIVGILVGGGLAVAVTFSSQGWVAGLVFLGILVVEHQLEGHILQPLVVGRWVRLHPLAVILAISVGGVLAGIPGAALAVPLVAVVYRVWPELRADPPVPKVSLIKLAPDGGQPPRAQPSSHAEMKAPRPAGNLPPPATPSL